MTHTPERAQLSAPLLERRSLGGGYHVLTLEAPSIARSARAGQFVLLGVRPAGEPLGDPILLRPFSFLARRPEHGVIELFLREVGRGTALLAELSPGVRLNLVGPLGNAWPDPGDGEVALVAGGVGMPPLLDLAESWRARGVRPAKVRVFYGGRSAGHIHLTERFEAAGCELEVCTDDGSLGTAGTNVAALQAWLEATGARSTVYACGPDVMMRAAALLAARRSLESWVSLEAPMACGIGVCRGCAVPHVEGGYRMVCSDGPVFRGEEVYW